MRIKKFDLVKLGKNMQETFGWEWSQEVTRRPNWWAKLKGAISTLGQVATPWRPGKFWEEHKGAARGAYDPSSVGKAVMGVGREEVRDIKKDATDIITSHANYSPQELADALKQKGHELEAIQQLSPHLKAVE